MAVAPAPVQVPSQRPLAPSVTSVANDKGDNEMTLGPVHRSPGICLKAEENPGKPQLGDHLMKGCIYRKQWFPYRYIITAFTFDYKFLQTDKLIFQKNKQKVFHNLKN